MLSYLASRASSSKATKSDIAEYREALKEREEYLIKERRRKKLSRNKLKKLALSNDNLALAKVEKIKAQLQQQYKKNQAIGKCKKWDDKRRATKLWSYIEKKINTEMKSVNGSWVKWNKEKMTPLAAAINQGDLRSVRALLAMKASPSIGRLEQGHWILPLEEAVWLGHEKISLLLLANGASETKRWCYGVLHGAIAKKMFPLVRLLIKKGASLDSTYTGRTPLCVALTCGSKGTGDIRMVRLLSHAKADLKKKTSGPRYSCHKGKLTHLEVAKKWSNAKCLRFISDKYIQ